MHYHRDEHGKSRQIVANETRKLRASDQARAAGISQAMRYDCGARKRPTVEFIDSTEAPVCSASRAQPSLRPLPATPFSRQSGFDYATCSFDHPP
jgi:hypothetical protein